MTQNTWMLVWVAVAGVLYTLSGYVQNGGALEALAGVVVGGALWPSRGISWPLSSGDGPDKRDL